jgi:long-chain acyl-CoA synthetase
MIADTRGRRAAAGKIGEIVVHSPGLARWYLESLGPAPISEAFATGDLGRLDNGGHLFLVGRKGSLIHASGKSIDPAVIEAVIGQMPGVRDVAAVGVPTSTGEDRIKAVVVSEAVTSARILEYCRQHLPQACVPDIVQFCDEIPRTPAGKVLRRILREPPRC